MSSLDRRAAARRQAWGRGPMILRFEPLEGRQLLSGATTSGSAPNLVATSFSAPASLNWGDTFQAKGTIENVGGSVTSSPYQIDVYASPTPTLAAGAVKIGSIPMGPGLLPGATQSFNQSVTLPALPAPGVGADSAFYVNLVVDPYNMEGEANIYDKLNRGLGIDSQRVAIAPALPSNLVGQGLSLTSNGQGWGGNVAVTATIANNGDGAAPATRALIALTPSGQLLGGASTVEIGALAVPALGPHQSVTLNQTIALPAVPPSTLSGATQFTATMVQDVDGQANPIFPHAPTQGLGLDQSSLALPLPVGQPAVSAPLPDLVASGVKTSTSTVVWGQPFVVSAAVANAGQAAAGPFRVRFFLAGPSGLAGGLMLGDTVLPGLAAGATQTVTQVVRFPGQPLAGLIPSSKGGSGLIVAQIDPNNRIDELTKRDNIAQSSPIILSLTGADGVAPTTPATSTPSAPVPVPAGKTRLVRRTQPKRTFRQGIGHLEHQFLKIFPHHSKRPTVKVVRRRPG